MTGEVMSTLNGQYPKRSHCARMYGLRRAKRKTEKIVQELEAGHATG